MEVHWGKHHRTYVDNLNKQIEGKPLADKSLEEVMQNAEMQMLWVTQKSSANGCLLHPMISA